MRDLYELVMLWWYIKLAMYSIDMWITASIFYNIILNIVVSTSAIVKRGMKKPKKTKGRWDF